MTRDKSGVYMIFHVILLEFIGLGITIFRVIYIIFHVNFHVKSNEFLFVFTQILCYLT